MYKLIPMVISLALLGTACAGKPYLEGSSGQSFLSEKKVPGEITSDDGFGWNISAGYLMSPHVAIEAGYTDYANANISQSGKDGADTRYSYQLALKRLWEVGQPISLFAKVGVAYVNSTLSNQLERDDNKSREQTNTNALVALGGMYQINDTFYLNTQFTLINENNNVGYSSLASFGFTWYLNTVCHTPIAQTPIGKTALNTDLNALH
jgi:hypothetical protein